MLHFILAWLLVGELAFGWFAFALAVLNGFIDFAKLHYQTSKTRRNWFSIDQLLHLAVLIGISLAETKTQIDFTTISSQFWIILTALILLTKPTSLIIKNIISIWAPENISNDKSLQNAGNYIGILERLFIFSFIITGHFEAIGFLLAAKSIFRFGDLKETKDQKLTIRFDWHAVKFWDCFVSWTFSSIRDSN